ncbi:GNAT family N-acetyltransferase [Candidatus Gracilibacteria bacterium]|nr:GNAT family N-acetyltransferase [Candidatus Gracilibacteria bacterium]NJM88634.1 GNAT family N-acetyltransferase [Hydrococcus sp. RU_2_2]NJP20625.1 GNAT family N-acetyltransferase [Hydrococcus sp. CRU_1_1]
MLKNSSIPISTIAQVLAESFADDPSFNLVFDRDINRLSAIQAFFEPFVADASERGKIIVEPNWQGACIWYPAEVEIFNEQFEQTLMEIIKTITKFAGEKSAQRFQHLIEQLGDSEPQQSHCEVFFLGLKPSARGKGIGQDLLKPVLDYADKNQVPCYLVSSTSRNISFYERHGFKKYCPIEINDTYSMTGMWRDFVSD